MFDGNGGEGVSGPGTVVGANVKLTGTISDVNDIVIHGTVEGEVISDKTVTITETASVKGPVTAQMVSVSGKVNGGVTAHQKLELLPTADVSGSIATKELIIKSGASFNGKSTMSREGSLEPKESAKTEPKLDKAAPATSTSSESVKAEEKREQLPAQAIEAPAVEIEE